jgi:hypothetical protein
VGTLGSVLNHGIIASETNLREITVSGASVVNTGTLRAINGGDILLAGAAFTNTGLVEIGAVGSQVRRLAGTYLQTGGETRLAGGTLNAATVSIQGGLLSGIGAITGSLVNAGTIVLGRAVDPTGTLTVSGTFQQAASGVLDVELAGTAIADYDRLLVTGAATLLGTLNVAIAGGFLPVVGNTFDVLTFASHVDDFDTINGLTPPGGPTLEAVFENTRLRLRVI